jgi:hypothetical protein
LASLFGVIRTTLRGTVVRTFCFTNRIDCF